MIAAADGSLFSKALERIPDQARRYIEAASGELPPEEVEGLWREYGSLCGRVLHERRPWALEYVPLLVRVFLFMDAERQEAERVKRAFDLAGENQRLVRRITSPLAVPTLAGADILADVLRAGRDDMRRAAGFLPESQQPRGRAV